MKYVSELEGARGLCAVWVLLGHWASSVALPFGLSETRLYNGYAVDIFILLSGFVITSLLETKKESFGLYLSRRFFRIFPLYLTFLLLSVVVAPYAVDIWSHAPEGSMKGTRIEIAQDTMDYWGAHLLAHLVALQSVVPRQLLPSTDFAFLGQAWSISLEWQFYLIAPLLTYGAAKGTAIRARGAIALLALFLILVGHAMPFGFIGRKLPLFLLGMGSYHLIKNGNRIPKTYVLYACFFLWCGGVVWGSPKVTPYLLWGALMAIVLLRRAGGAGIAAGLSRFLQSAPVQFLGHLSYPVYLSHMLVILSGLWLGARFGYQDMAAFPALLLGYVLVGTGASSYLAHRYIEKPCHNFGRRLGKEPRVRGAA